MKCKLLLAVSLVTVILYGCNKDEVKDVPANAPADQNASQQTGETPTDQMTFNFIEFSLDVDYSATESYEVEYEDKKTGIEAKLQDDRKNEKLQGDEAYTKLEPLFKQLNFDSTTPNDKVIDQVIKVFNIDDSFQSIEVDVEFVDGNEKEFKRIK
ncbi:YusW family protein [Lysinibacillus irui]|uniref:YusW family protein n=1 Tax=Lysinibacillus irui TaxID=2998077 RepID=A0ABU5NLL8_9BACI|nr:MULTISPECIES: YusW family protein [Lysinibacillus]MEA0555847.1 YusW family protein [Lysinibacillus irui]MEA0976925.1 YusW family protein [Lysinibacillus irui]MEA1043079.1 YusW family protein [Lysinibacillus irui]